MISVFSDNEENTLKIGYIIGEYLTPGDIILLYGDLGAGKTMLAKGIAKGAGAKEPVTSPTFSLMNQYNGRCPVYHFDLYRISNPDELYDLDYEEYFFGGGITIVEWPERLDHMLPDKYIKTVITRTDKEHQRKLDFYFIGNANKDLSEVLKNI